MRFLLLIILLISPCIASPQNEVNAEWIENDVSIFNYFFDNFPLDSGLTVDDLKTKLSRFKDASYDSTGFGGILYSWTLPGGTTSINSNILTYNGKVAAAETVIYQDYIKGLNRVLKKDTALKSIFNKYFVLQVNLNYFNDSVYVYTYTNNEIFHNYKIHVAKRLGEIKKIDLSKNKFEYHLLIKPTGAYYFDERYFNHPSDYPPVVATQKLIESNQIDHLFNIIKGYSLPGRLYGIMGILKLVQQKKYSLTTQDKELIKKVLSLDLKVAGGFGLITHTKYADCLNTEATKIIEKTNANKL